MDDAYKLKITFGNQIKNLGLLILVSISYYCLIMLVAKDFIFSLSSHIFIIILLLPTLYIHISYVIKNYGDEYFVLKNSIVDKRKGIEYCVDEIMKVEIHKFGNLPHGNHFLPFHSYKFCRIILKNGNSFILTSLLKYNIDEFLKENMEGIVFDRHYEYFPRT